MKSKFSYTIFPFLLLLFHHSKAQFFTSLKAPMAPGERSAMASVALRGLSVSQVRISVVYGTDSMAIVNAFDLNRNDPTRYFETNASQIGPVIDGSIQATVVFPHADRPVANSREKRFMPGTKIFYTWARTHTPSGTSSELTVTNGNVLSFEMPRPVTIALLGDSYASGEGAKGNNWINEPCHRSRNGGGELAIRKLKDNNKNIEVDYVNVTCSGAKLTDFYQQAQLKDDNNPSKGTKQGLQVDLVENWLRSKGYDELDVLMADGGGNDLGFGDVVVQGLTSVFSEFRGDTELMNRVATAFARIPDNYFLFKTYLDSKISVGRVVWFNYPNPITGNPLPNGGFDANLCKPGIISAKRTCWFPENSLNESDWKFIYDKFLVPLNQSVAAAASTHGWDLVDVSNEALRKGICNCDGYFNSFLQSLQNQGDQYGTMHPNPTGFREIYRDKLYNQLLSSIDKVQKRERSDVKSRAIAAAKEKARAQMQFKSKASSLNLVMAAQSQLSSSLSKYRVVVDPKKFNIDPSKLQKVRFDD